MNRLIGNKSIGYLVHTLAAIGITQYQSRTLAEGTETRRDIGPIALGR